MWWVPLVFLLGVLCSGSSSQLVVTQPPLLANATGSTVKIPCAISSGYNISSDRVRWYQQKPGGVPLFLYHYHTSSDQGRGSGVPERFTVSPDTSNNLWNLVITGVQAEDEADYHCYTWDGALAQFILTQPPSTSASTGETVKIPCVKSSGGIGDYYVTWYQQKAGNVPKLLIYKYSYRPSEIPDRFSGSMDTSANSASLTISNIQAEDEADYYCMSYAGSYKSTVIQPQGK